MFCLNKWRPGSRNSPKFPQLLWEVGISVLLKTRLNSFHRQNKETEAPEEGAHLAWSPQLGLALTRRLACGVQAPASHTGAFPEFTARSKWKMLFLVFLSSKYRRYVQEILQVKREVGKKLKYLKGLLWNKWVRVKLAWNHPEKHLEAAAAIHHVCIHRVCLFYFGSHKLQTVVPLQAVFHTQGHSCQWTDPLRTPGRLSRPPSPGSSLRDPPHLSCANQPLSPRR